MKFRSCKYSFVPVDPLRSGVRNLKGALAVSLLALMSACGGGGGGGGSTTATPVAGPPVTPVTPGVTTYALAAGFKALKLAGSVDNFAVAGDCSGTARTANGAATASSFEGTAGFSTAESATLSLPTCSSTTTSSTGTDYYDANFAPLGSVNAAGAYTVVAGSPLTLPTTVKVGDTQAAYFVYVSYSDSTKTVRTGQVIEGYSIEADTTNPSTTANTAIYHSTSKAYDNANNLLSTQQTYYRMGTDGGLKLLSLDVLYTGTLFASHLVYTRTD